MVRLRKKDDTNPSNTLIAHYLSRRFEK